MQVLERPVLATPGRRAAVPLRFAPWGLLALVVFVCGAAIVIGGDRPALHFKDDGAMSWLNAAQLVAASAFAFAVYVAMVGRPTGADRRPTLWLLISLGCFALALDEWFEIHGAVGPRLERLTHLPPVGPSAGDALLLSFVLLGVGVIWRYRREFARSRSALLLFGLGALLLAVSETVDVLSDGPLNALATGVSYSRNWLSVAEEGPKFVGCGAMLAGLLQRFLESVACEPWAEAARGEAPD